MALRKPNSTDDRKSSDKKAFRVDTSDPSAWYRAVVDEIGHTKLDAIVSALGGSSDTTPNIINTTIIAANTEVSQVMPANTKTFLIRSRSKGKLRLAFASGGTNADYLTIPAGSSFESRQFFSTLTVYLQSTKPGDIVEILAYV